VTPGLTQEEPGRRAMGATAVTRSARREFAMVDAKGISLRSSSPPLRETGDTDLQRKPIEIAGQAEAGPSGQRLPRGRVRHAPRMTGAFTTAQAKAGRRVSPRAPGLVGFVPMRVGTVVNRIDWLARENLLDYRSCSARRSLAPTGRFATPANQRRSRPPARECCKERRLKL